MMRRIIFSIMMTVLSVTTMCALTNQEIAGTWQSKKINVPTEEPGMKITNVYTINYDGDSIAKVGSAITLNIDLGQKITADCYFRVEADGKYKINGDAIIVNLDPESISINLSEDDVRVNASYYVDPVRLKEMSKMIYNNMMSTFNLRNILGFQTNYILVDVKVSDKKMTCVDDDVKMEFVRKKKF